MNERNPCLKEDVIRLSKNLLGTLNALLGASVKLLTMCKHDIEKEN